MRYPLARVTLWRIWVVLAVAVLSAALLSPVSRSAAAGEACPEGESSTPGVRLVVVDPGRGDPLVAITAQTSLAGDASSRVVYRDDGVRIVGYEVHRIFLGEVHEESTDGHTPGDGHDPGVVAHMRGLGTLADGTQVRMHVDVQDLGDTPYVDRLRVRYRDATGHDPGSHESSTPAAAATTEDPAAHDGHDGGGCSATWLYSSGWMSVRLARLMTAGAA